MRFLNRPARLLNRPARAAVASLVLVAALFLFVFPTRSLLAQRHQIAGAQHSLDVLRAQNARLEKEAAKLKTNAEVERIARSEYHMVRPGEQAYTVLPAPASTSTTVAP